jgi:hypothetical protein
VRRSANISLAQVLRRAVELELSCGPQSYGIMSRAIDARFPKTEFSFAKIEFDGASGLSTYIMSKWPSDF